MRCICQQTSQQNNNKSPSQNESEELLSYSQADDFKLVSIGIAYRITDA